MVQGDSMICIFVPRYKWQLLAWFSQNGIKVDAKMPKKQLYAIYFKVRGKR